VVQQSKHVESTEAPPSALPEHRSITVGSSCEAAALSGAAPSELELLEELADPGPASAVKPATSLDVSQLGEDDLRGHVFQLGGRTYAVLSCAVPPPPRLDGLSKAETEVVFAALNGLTNEEIAATRGRSIFTIQNQLAAAWRKLGVSSRHEAAAVLAGRRRLQAARIELPGLLEDGALGEELLEDEVADAELSAASERPRAG
jgi:DNA-binding CsgD family transcriptional regulator